ncbi:MAG: anthranilate synthase component I family protein [Planctomycetota bacterium]|nr:anthranilate synthase component I family protein [Planctomycetota bacterium]
MKQVIETTGSDWLVVQDSYDGPVNAAGMFARLTDRGAAPGSILLESGELAPLYAQRSYGLFRPSLCVLGKDERFEIRALDDRGRAMLPCVRARLPQAAAVSRESDGGLEGTVNSDRAFASFEERLRDNPIVDVLRAVLPQRAGCHEEESAAIGLFGCFAYDFVRHFEKIPLPREDRLNDPDFIFYFSSRLFVTDHLNQRTSFMSVVPRDGADAFLGEAQNDLLAMRNAVSEQEETPRRTASVGPFTSDVSRQAFCEKVDSIKQAIAAGRVYQVVYGRMLQADFTGDPFAVYQALKQCNPSPFMFYMRDERGALLGASPELAVRVSNHKRQKKVEIRPIAGTKPRGIIAGAIDPDLDERFELALKIDPKELAEHTMLIDLARNDIAGVAKPGTVRLEQAFEAEKFSHVQHLVSQVSGVLRDGLDAFDAYVATMNMGTLTGAPKPEAMKMISELEQSARGFFGGGVGFVTVGGEMETAIVIRAMRTTNSKVYIRAGAGIVADSVPQREWDETANKAQACIQALREVSENV